ncbi:MAG: hypothetical protein ACI3ZC_10565 [Candidatus Cryptobacteroides sp.]
MKFKCVVAAVAALVFCLDSYAAGKQESYSSDYGQTSSFYNKRKKFLYFGYTNQSLEAPGHSDYSWDSKYGANLTVGRTSYLHKKPIAGIIKFGLDYGMSMNVVKYNNAPYQDLMYSGGYEDGYESGDEESAADNFYNNLQGDLGLFIGPSLTINPVSKLRISLYGRFLPSYSALYLSEDYSGCFAPFITYGANISWGVISVGVEARSATMKRNVPELMEISDYKDNAKLKTSAVTFYIGFRLGKK